MLMHYFKFRLSYKPEIELDMIQLMASKHTVRDSLSKSVQFSIIIFMYKHGDLMTAYNMV